MANLKEQERWEDGIYQIEENDPVLGGENGITNKPAKQLANRTVWLKKAFELLTSKSKPKDLSAESESTADENGHSHALPKSSTSQQGIVQLDSAINSSSESKAATPKAVKTVKDQLDSVQRNQANYIPNSKKSSSVTSNSGDTVATSAAAKTAYDKAVEALNKANTKQSPATTLAGYGITDGVVVKGAQNVNLNQLLNESAVWLVTGADKETVGFSDKDIYNYGVGLTLASGPCASMLYMPHALAKPKLYLKSYFNSYTPSPWAEVAMVDDVVRKTGDTMTGILEIDCAANFVRGKRTGANKWYVGTPNGATDDVALHNYSYSHGLILKSDRVETLKPLFVGANRVPHAGDAYMELTSSNYGGITIHRPERNDKMMMASSGDSFVFIRRNRTNQQNHYAVHMPATSGTLLLDNDLTGAIMHFAMSSAPAGWLKANGAAVSRTTYAALFAVIGTTFGAGDGRTTFNLPDLRGEFIRGWDDGRNVDSSRRFGSSQSASMQALSSAGSQFVMGITNKDNNPNYIWSRAQHDKIAKGESVYQDIKVSYTETFSWHGRNQVGFVNNGNNNVEFGAMRPRNIALLACIKY